MLFDIFRFMFLGFGNTIIHCSNAWKQVQYHYTTPMVSAYYWRGRIMEYNNSLNYLFALEDTYIHKLAMIESRLFSRFTFQIITLYVALFVVANLFFEKNCII